MARTAACSSGSSPAPGNICVESLFPAVGRRSGIVKVDETLVGGKNKPGERGLGGAGVSSAGTPGLAVLDCQRSFTRVSPNFRLPDRQYRAPCTTD